MRERRTLQELTFKDGFLFAAAMMDQENCRLVLERILEMPIDRVEVSKEKSFIYNPDHKGVRLDVYAKDENGTHFDVEMQVASEHLLKRARYYHAQMDMDLIDTGASYERLFDGYVIFICDFDPLGLGKYRYTVQSVLKEDGSYLYEDGIHTIFMSTKGKNDDEVPRELVNFLHFVGASLEESDKDYGDELVNRLQESISRIKTDREIGGRYMTLEEIRKREFQEGKAEGKAESHQVTAALSQKLRQGESVDALLEEGFAQEDIDFVKEILQL